MVNRKGRPFPTLPQGLGEAGPWEGLWGGSVGGSRGRADRPSWVEIGSGTRFLTSSMSLHHFPSILVDVDALFLICCDSGVDF